MPNSVNQQAEGRKTFPMQDLAFVVIKAYYRKICAITGYYMYYKGAAVKLFLPSAC